VLFPKCLGRVNFITTFLGLGGLLLSLVCVFQREGKVLIAISSVVHISFFLIVLRKNRSLGFISSFTLIISHGIVSGLLFYLVGLLYSRLLSREIVYHKGMIKRQLIMGVVIFLVLLINGGLAPTASFFVELWGLSSLYAGNLSILSILLFYFIFSFYYRLRYALTIIIGGKGVNLYVRPLLFVLLVFIFFRGFLIVKVSSITMVHFFRRVVFN